MAPVWKALRDANCNSKISIFEYTYSLLLVGNTFPLMDMLSVVLGKKVQSALLSERKFAARSSSPWSLSGLPSFTAACCADFLWAQVGTRDWNGPVKRHSLIAGAVITSSTWASVKVTGYICRLPEDQVHTVSPWQTGVFYWLLGLLKLIQIPSWLGRVSFLMQHHPFRLASNHFGLSS